jgi:hypothetical protein
MNTVKAYFKDLQVWGVVDLHFENHILEIYILEIYILEIYIFKILKSEI